MKVVGKCESPIEQAMLEALRDEPARNDLTVVCQQPIHASGRNYRADLYVEVGERRVVIECDGKDFHDYNRDKERDGMMLRYGGIHYVFRFRGCDVNFYRPTCIAVMRALCPGLFDSLAIPPVLSQMIVFSKLLGMEKGCKPIIRCKVPVWESCRVPTGLGDAQTFAGHGVTPDYEWYIAHFQTPYWDWKTGKVPDGIYSIGEIVDQVFEEMSRGRGEMNLRQLGDRF